MKPLSSSQLDVQFSTKNYKTYKETAKYDLFIGRKKLTETTHKEAQTLDLLGKDFTLTVLNMLGEWKEIDKYN